jgi:hypothetical protein
MSFSDLVLNFKFATIVVFSVMLFPKSASAASGEVVYRQSGCDYFVVQTRTGYDLLEWFGGHDPDKGDILVGKFEEYGMHDIYDRTADDEITVWVEEYGESKESVLEKMVEACE